MQNTIQLVEAYSTVAQSLGVMATCTIIVTVRFTSKGYSLFLKSTVDAISRLIKLFRLKK